MKTDEMIGRIREKIDRDTALIILSDHGLNLFRRGVNLNTWLKEEDYLCLKPGKRVSGEWFQGVDWSRTKAYALGLSGIYLNLAGREGKGIVD